MSELQYFSVEKNRYKIIEKVSKSEFNLIETAPTLEAARIMLDDINTVRDGCFFIRYPKVACDAEPGIVVKKKGKFKSPSTFRPMRK